jgi:pyridoxamine 5'-phosphate oxidase
LRSAPNIFGTAAKISVIEPMKYFATRPPGNQIRAWTSQQSQVIKSRAMLDGMFDQMKQKFLDGEVPLPSSWGSYNVSPETTEFWQAQESRLHDRFIYARDEESHWFTERLAP